MHSWVPVHSHSSSSDADCEGLAALLRVKTKSLHVAAEQSGIIREILGGKATRDGYALLLRNLLPVYRGLECGLDRHIGSPGIRTLAWPPLYRTHAIETDLIGLGGPHWRKTLALLPEGEHYAQCIEAAAEGPGVRLIAHAYVRYLGDLSGGRIVKRLLMRSLGLNASVLSYYEFKEIADVAKFKLQFRNALDRAAVEIDDVAAVVDEAVAAFRLNIALSEAVYAAAHR